MEPSARLYDGSTTSNAIFDVEQRLVVMAECLVVTTGRVRPGVEKACADEATSTVMTIELVARIVPTAEVGRGRFRSTRSDIAASSFGEWK